MHMRHTSDTLTAITSDRETTTLSLSDGSRDLGTGASFATGRECVGYEPDANHVVETSEVVGPPVAVTVVDTDTGEREQIHDGGTANLDSHHLAVVHTSPVTLLRPSSPASISLSDEETRLTLTEGRDTVGVGWDACRGDSPEVVAVERSVAGVVDAVESLGVAVGETSPDRTWPNARGPLPRVEWVGEAPATATRPAEVETPDTDTEVVLPGNDPLSHLFPAVTLVHYVSASVTVADDASTTVLRAGEETFDLGGTPEEIDETASEYLRRVFYLDCLARSAGPYGTRLDEADALDAAGLDAETLYHSTLADRVRRYLGLDGTAAQQVADTVPQWHHAVHVRPEIERAPHLSRHLSTLADVCRPEAATLDTLGDRARWAADQEATVRGGATEAISTEPFVVPESPARTVGWDAPSRPLDAYSYRSAPPTPTPDGRLSVTVAHVDPQYDASGVLQRYRDREGDLPLTVSTVGSPSVADLARTVEADNDLLHVVAHHDHGGIACRDGTLTADEIADCGAEVVMLNACGSWPFGASLVDLGATASVVTTGEVGDDLAAEVGTDWAGMISLGWSVARATDMARRATAPEAYSVVGDGAAVVTPSDSFKPPAVEIDDDREQIRVSHAAPHRPGARMEDTLADTPHLAGTRVYDLTDENLQRVADHHDSPVLRNGSLQWL